MVTCPYCSGKVLRHFHNSQLYWFCRHCWREVPLLDTRYRENSSICRSTLSKIEPSFDLHAYLNHRLLDDEIISDSFR
jgi:DNA-directed RNA polymerase subunit RPC12/RpoP